MVPHYCWAGSFSHLQISSNDGIRVKVAVKREGHDGVIVEISNQKIEMTCYPTGKKCTVKLP